MITIKYSETLENNTWNFFEIGKSGKRDVITRCSNGHIGSLANHEIAIDGTVSPSVVCQHEGCSYHEFIILDDYEYRMGLWIPKVKSVKSGYPI